MADIYSILADIYKGIGDTVKECGFEPVIPEGTEKDACPTVTDSGRITIEFKGENKALKIEHFNNKLTLFGASKEGEIIASDFSVLSSSLLEAETANDKDVKYFVNDYCETLVETFGTKTQKPKKSKLPQPVSKAAAKSGQVTYDPNTLANRFTTIYPELREEYKANCDRYGQFLPEDFFVNHGNAVVLATIRENDSAKMKKLFNLLNDIYEDGNNDVQGVIAVTILGSLDNDTELLGRCCDYMSDELAVNVININRFLASKSGKGAKMKLANPPKYKPEKAKKKKGAFSSLGM